MVSDRLVTLIVVTSLITSAVAAGVGAGAATSGVDNGSFAVEISGMNTPVAEGETLVVEATVTNTGSEEDSQQIHLKRDESIVDSAKNPPVTLAPGESAEVTLEWTPEYGETGSTEISVQSDDDSAVTTVDVQEGPTFPVSVESTSGPVTVGESLTVSVTVRNTAETNETTTVALAAADETQAETSVELAAGETKQVDLTWETTANDTGTRTVEVVSADDATTATVDVTEPGSDGSDSGGSDSSSSTGVPGPVSERSHSLIEGDRANVTGHDVEYVEFATATDGRITVDKLRHLPETVDEIDDVAAVYRIDVPAHATTTNATIGLTIDAGELDGATPDTIVVHLWEDGNWTALETEATATGDDEVTITANTTGFSMFAVTTGNEPTGVAETETPTETETNTDTETPTETETEAASSTDSATDTAAEDSTATEESNEALNGRTAEIPGFGIGAALLALLSVVVLGGYVTRRN